MSSCIATRQSIRLTISIISTVLRHKNVNNFVHAVTNWRKGGVSLYSLCFTVTPLFQCIQMGLYIHSSELFHKRSSFETVVCHFSLTLESLSVRIHCKTVALCGQQWQGFIEIRLSVKFVISCQPIRTLLSSSKDMKCDR